MEVLYKVLDRYPYRKRSCNVIRHPRNLGSGSARNTGVQHANGSYIIHIDSDDWCKLDMLSKMLSVAYKYDSDIVCSDFFIVKDNSIVYRKEEYSGNK